MPVLTPALASFYVREYMSPSSEVFVVVAEAEDRPVGLAERCLRWRGHDRLGGEVGGELLLHLGGRRGSGRRVEDGGKVDGLRVTAEEHGAVGAVVNVGAGAGVGAAIGAGLGAAIGAGLGAGAVGAAVGPALGSALGAPVGAAGALVGASVGASAGVSAGASANIEVLMRGCRRCKAA